MSDKKRINEISKETGLTNQDLVAVAQGLGLGVKSHSSSVTDDEARRIVAAAKTGNIPTPSVKKAVKGEEKVVAVDKPLTFQGKAVVIDEAILARRAARDAEAKKAEMEKLVEKSSKTVVMNEPTTDKPSADKRAVSADNVPQDNQSKAAAPATSSPVITIVKKSVEKPVDTPSKNNPNDHAKGDKPKHSPSFSEKKATSAKAHHSSNGKTGEAHKPDQSAAKKSENKPEIKKPMRRLDTKPRIQIKVVKKAEFKEEPKRDNKKPMRGGARNGDRSQNNRQTTAQNRTTASKAASHSVQKRVFNDTPAVAANTARRRNSKKETHRGESKYNDGGRPGGPLHVNDNRNQVRNARNANWNNARRGRKSHEIPQVERKFVELPKSFEYDEAMTIADIAKKLHREPAEFIKKLFLMGSMATQNTSLDDETIELLLMEYNITPVKKVVEDKSDIEHLFVEEGYLHDEAMTARPPVVTIMGHVDHGKTTLLDHLRKNAINVTEGEAGGITQHIGAYQLEANGKKITFLDTPGHEAFTAMRARGASVTDITVLVVAADDGVMPQTVEAINHSKAADVPIIVAINKIDKEGANPQRVIQELAEHEVMPTEWGGNSEFVEISAKFDKNIDGLLETILLVADMQELKADPTVRAIGTVIEARLDKGKGAIATLLVQQGTLHQQDPIVAGNTFGRVRAMVNEAGRRLKQVGPSTAVEITGLNDVPQAGDHFAVFEDEKSARSAGEERFKRAQLIQRQNVRRVSLENLFDTIKEGQVKTIPIIIKADVQGSAEALATSLQKIEVEGVKVDIVHSAVGAINESDVALATASNAIIIGFNVRPTPEAREEANREDVEIRLHSIIYKVIDEIEDSMKGMLDPEFKEEVVGEAVVQEIFTVSKVGTIAGFMVVNGKVLREASVRIIREGVVMHDGPILSLKHLKDDVKEVGNAQEGGLMVDGFNDILPGDTLEIYQMVEIKR